MKNSNPKKVNSKEAQNYFEFVINELERFQDLSQDTRKYIQAIKNDGWLYDITFPDGTKRVIGREAHKRLVSLSKKIIEGDNKLRGRVGVDSLLPLLKTHFVKAIFDENQVKPLEIIQRCVDDAVIKLLVEKIYYIPCILPYYKGIREFRIGPVAFTHKKNFFESRQNDIQESKYHNISEFQKIYDIQNWIAQIKISGFDEKKSRERAYLCVRLAIASIKCLFDLRRAQWLGSEEQSLPKLRILSLQSYPNSEQNSQIQFSSRIQFILNADNAEIMNLLSHESRYWFQVFGSFLDSIKDKGEWKFLDSKIVTAMIWLDIGNSPISNAERIVAFANCLETLFVTSDSGIRHQIVSRSKNLLEISGWDKDKNSKIEEFYGIRSGIVHGEIMPINDNLEDSVKIGKYLSDVCVEGFLHFSYWLLIKHREQETREHERPYNGRGSFTKALEEELPLFIKEKLQSSSIILSS